MSQVLTIYSTKLRVDISAILQETANKAGASLTAQFEEEGRSYTLTDPKTNHTLKFWQHSVLEDRKGQQKHVRDMITFAANCIGLEMDGTKWAILHHLSKIRWSVSVFGEPRFSSIAGGDECVLRVLAESKGITYDSWKFYDASDRLLLDEEGRTDPKSRVPKFPSAYARKERTEAKITKLGIKPSLSLLNLPITLADEEMLIRPPKEVARRAVCLYVVGMRATHWPRSQAKSFIRSEGIGDWFTPAERDFLQQIELSDEDKLNFSWRFEAFYLLMWSLKLVADLGLPRKMCSVTPLAAVIEERGVAGFLDSATMRTAAEICDERDLLYRLHWAVRNADRHGEKPPAKLSSDVITEWHHAINWLTLYFYSDWDDVKTDT